MARNAQDQRQEMCARRIPKRLLSPRIYNILDLAELRIAAMRAKNQLERKCRANPVLFNFTQPPLTGL